MAGKVETNRRKIAITRDDKERGNFSLSSFATVCRVPPNEIHNESLIIPQEISDLQEQLADLMRHLETQQAIASAPDGTRQVNLLCFESILSVCDRLSDCDKRLQRFFSVQPHKEQAF